MTSPTGRPPRRGRNPARDDRATAKPVAPKRDPAKPKPAAKRKPLADAAGSATKRHYLAGLLLDEIEGSRDTADKVRNGWFRGRPGIATAERVQIERLADDVLRRRPALDWWLLQAGSPLDNRARLVACEILVRKRGANRLPPLPAALRQLAAKLDGRDIDHPDMPAAARASAPDWLLPDLRRRFGPALGAEMAALARPAPLDLRVNTLAGSREAAAQALAKEHVETDPTPFSPLGLRTRHPVDIGASQALEHGVIEPQDEGSQLAAALVEAAPGQFVIDLCAGAGGKTLALGAAMAGRGRLIAIDVSEGRLARARQRLRRAGVHNAELRPLDPKWLKRQKGSADRVLVDAPCSGTGVWRRKPDARWRLRPEDIAELVMVQADLLDRAARLVRPGGRLIYVTCSLLEAEDEAQVTAFLARNPAFRIEPIGPIWTRTVGGTAPVKGDTLLLTPARHGTDGFFVAVLTRTSA